MLNPFFLNGTSSEQNLIQSLVNEQLKMYGVEVFYLPRLYASSKTIIREVIESEFKNAYPLEAYVDSYEGYGGQGTILSKFGIENRDDLTLVISRERYENYITPLTKQISNIQLATRPKEGDLIYFPLGDRLFEIKFVEHEQPFYQLKKNYVYELKCELYRYEDEVIDTGIETIDDEIAQIGYIQTLNLIGAGRTATATAEHCSSGSISDIYISNMGRNFRSTPTVGFSSAPSGGTTAAGIASVSYSYPGCKGTSGVVPLILLTNAGCGYTEAPMITVSGGGGAGFAATTGIATNGSVKSITVTDGGSGYITAPKVTIGSTLGAGTTHNYAFFDSTNHTFDSTEHRFSNSWPSPSEFAVGIATISSSGIVTAIYIVSSGNGYDSAPIVYIDPPKSISEGVSVGGEFVFNEVVTGSTSGTTARVKEWNTVTDTMEVGVIDGTFVVGELLTGSTSGAKYLISDKNEDDLVTPFADNDTIEIAADKIIDFSSNNPFGMP